jgi:hypothetical protein
MEWLFWITCLCFVFTLILFTILYSTTELACVWPPCVSELIEAHKALVLVMFGFTSGLIWLNLIIISLIVHRDGLVALATLMFLSVMGLIAFDLSHYRLTHYLFVLMYTATSTAFANIIFSDKLYVFTICVNWTTALFLLFAFYTSTDERWGRVSKYFYTVFECLWIISFFAYVLAHAFENMHAYNSLLLLVNCTTDTVSEDGLHFLL